MRYEFFGLSNLVGRIASAYEKKAFLAIHGFRPEVA
jgi:hypothetical protein